MNLSQQSNLAFRLMVTTPVSLPLQSTNTLNPRIAHLESLKAQQEAMSAIKARRH